MSGNEKVYSPDEILYYSEVTHSKFSSLHRSKSPSTHAISPMYDFGTILRPGKHLNLEEANILKPAIDELQLFFRVSKQKADDFSAMSENSTLSSKIHLQNAIKIYSYISKILYSTISLSKVPELIAFIRHTGSVLPSQFFDLDEWESVFAKVDDFRVQEAKILLEGELTELKIHCQELEEKVIKCDEQLEQQKFMNNMNDVELISLRHENRQLHAKLSEFLEERTQAIKELRATQSICLQQTKQMSELQSKLQDTVNKHKRVKGILKKQNKLMDSKVRELEEELELVQYVQESVVDYAYGYSNTERDNKGFEEHDAIKKIKSASSPERDFSRPSKMASPTNPTIPEKDLSQTKTDSSKMVSPTNPTNPEKDLSQQCFDSRNLKDDCIVRREILDLKADLKNKLNHVKLPLDEVKKEMIYVDFVWELTNHVFTNLVYLLVYVALILNVLNILSFSLLYG